MPTPRPREPLRRVTCAPLAGETPEQTAARIVAAAGPPTPEQRARLVTLLLSGREMDALPSAHAVTGATP